jgi:predicted 3-demethylubiquinone-9 3-methyltransferase (glyoxalase superfamily)
MSKVTPCLWFEHDAEAAARFYCSLLPDSHVDHVQRSATDTPSGPAGSVLMVAFTLGGQKMQALNGGRSEKPSQAISLSISCADQAEVDHVWDALADGGQPIQCGWIKDRWGFSWQVVPRAMIELFGDPDRARAGRAMKAMMGMVKLDIAALRAAADAG